jgi:hypothetical protein
LTKVKPRASRGATHSSGWPDSSGLAVFPHCLMLLLTLLAAACSLGCATAAVWEV